MHCASVLGAAVFAAAQATAQLDVQMSQYMFNGMVLSPAHAGQHEAINIQVLYRQQWVGVPGAPNTQIIAVDGASKNGITGLGAIVMRDNIGSLNNLGAYANYAFRLRLNNLNDRLCFGLAAGIVQNSFARYEQGALGGFGQNLYDHQLDDILNNEKPVYMPDFKVGILYEMQDIFYLGLTANNLGSFLSKKEDSTLVVQAPIASINGGGNIQLNNNWALRPAFLYSQPISRMLPGAASGQSSSLQVFPPMGTLDISLAAVLKERFWLGATYRMGIGNGNAYKNAIIAMAEIWITSSIRLGYAYDFSLKFVGMQQGTHEISLGFTPFKKVVRYRSAKDF
ncbi:membrane protein [Bacteroidia bacterium]|nr:membrane protein [Bacteroidia bacterium]